MPHCNGIGVEVRAREVKVRIPAGVDDGQRIRVKGRGGAGANGGPPGDLYVVVHVRDARVVRAQWPRPDAAVAGDVPGGRARSRHQGPHARLAGDRADPAGHTERQGVARARQGVAADGNGKGTKEGDLLVTVDVQVPANLTTRQREAVEALTAVLDEDPRAALAAGAQDRRKRDGE